MANWPDNKAPRHDVDDSTPRVVPGALLHSQHHTPDLPHRDQHATKTQKPDISTYNTEKLRPVASSLVTPCHRLARRQSFGGGCESDVKLISEPGRLFS